MLNNPHPIHIESSDRALAAEPFGPTEWPVWSWLSVALDSLNRSQVANLGRSPRLVDAVEVIRLRLEKIVMDTMPENGE